MACSALMGETEVRDPQGRGSQAHGQVGRPPLFSGGASHLGLCRGWRSRGLRIGSFRRLPWGRRRYVAAQKREQPVLIPACPGLIGTRLVVVHLGTTHAVVHVEEKLDVEGGVVLIRLGRQGWASGPGQLARLTDPVLAGDARSR